MRVADVAVLPIDPMNHYNMYDPLINQGLHIVGRANVTVKGYIDQRASIIMRMGLDDPAAGTAKVIYILFQVFLHFFNGTC
jgi:hypothetical protein